MQDGGDNVWQNPDTEYRRWQQYMGTAIWGDPPFEKETTGGLRFAFIFFKMESKILKNIPRKKYASFKLTIKYMIRLEIIVI
jgi:hypothetical protein